MTAKRSDWKPWISYSTNVHRGESLADLRSSLEAYTVPIRDRVFGKRQSGVELRLGIRAARELRSRRALESFGAFLRERDLVLFSVNAFPLLDFHARRVKEKVYLPSWRDAERVRWTNRIAEILAELMPVGVVGSVSTLAGAFRPGSLQPRVLRRMALNFLRTVESLARLEAEKGKTVVLAVEPEPETTLETAGEVIRFFEDHLVPLGRERWRGEGLSASRCERRLRKFFTVNLDACHLSVLFQDLRGSVDEILRAGLSVGKVHVTSALSLPNPRRRPAAYRQLRGMHEPRYFHQFAGRDARGDVAWRGLDLDELPRELRRGRDPEVTELRSHYHVPLHRKSWRLLRTTRDETRDLVLEVARRRLCSQLVVETYTWPLLESPERLVDGIVRELRWLLGVLEREGLGTDPPPRRAAGRRSGSSRRPAAEGG